MRQNRFKKADQDGDGKITKDELSKVVPKNGKGPGVDDIFSKIDTNQDGAIDETEDKAAMEQMKSHGPPKGPPDASKMAQAIFKKVDGDNDGSISKSELTSALSETEDAPNSEALFKALDSDEDGSITQSELEDTLKKLFEQMKTQHSGAAFYDSSGNTSATAKASVQGEFSALA